MADVDELAPKKTAWIAFLDDQVREAGVAMKALHLTPTRCATCAGVCGRTQTEDGTYHNRINKMIANRENRVLVNFNDLRRKNPELARSYVPCRPHTFTCRISLLNNAVCRTLMAPMLDVRAGQASATGTAERADKGEMEAAVGGEPDSRFHKHRPPLRFCSTDQAALKELVDNIDSTFSKAMDGTFLLGFEGGFGAHHVTPRGLSARLLGAMVCIEGIVSKCTRGAPSSPTPAAHGCHPRTALLFGWRLPPPLTPNPGCSLA
jgi:hypothetical protein